MVPLPSEGSMCCVNSVLWHSSMAGGWKRLSRAEICGRVMIEMGFSEK